MEIRDEAYISRKMNFANDSDGKNLRLLSDRLKSDAAKATRIQIVSGYFGEDYVLELLKQVSPKKARSSCVVKLIFGYDSTTELFYGQIRIFNLKRGIIGLGFKKGNITIKLFKDSAPLHTKLYGFLIKTRPIWYIGSANLSKAIDGDRHELMVRVTGKSHALDAYIQALLTHKSHKTSDDNPEIIGLNRFFSAGSILFRPSRYPRFTYDGFVINKDDRQKISKQLGRDSMVPHSDPSAEGFGFDLISAIGITNIAEDELRPVKIIIRPYCVETAYGYWVPSAYTHVIESKIAKGKISEEKKFRTIRDALKKMADTQLVVEFQAYLDASDKFFKEIGVEAKQKKNVQNAFISFLRVRRDWLQDDEWIKRNSSKLFLTKMPDIWNDEYATASFVESFCDDVCSVLNSPEKKPKIYQKISDRLQLVDSPTADDIRSKLESVKGAFWN